MSDMGDEIGKTILIRIGVILLVAIAGFTVIAYALKEKGII